MLGSFILVGKQPLGCGVVGTREGNQFDPPGLEVGVQEVVEWEGGRKVMREESSMEEVRERGRK